MTSTAQLVRSSKTSSASEVLPTDIKTAQKSALFVKKLLAVTVSNLTYLRAIFPEAAFGDRCLEDLNLKILKDDSACSGAQQVVGWVKGCFDAIEKKYLRMIVIGLYTDPDHPEKVIESYTFKFSYNENDTMEIYRNSKKISNSKSDSKTKKAAVQLLRTLVVLTQSLEPLPNDTMMTMKLYYYDDVTPGDYEPPGFKAATSDTFTFENEPMNIKVGDVATDFHTIKLRIKTDAKQFEDCSNKDASNSSCKATPSQVPVPVVSPRDQRVPSTPQMEDTATDYDTNKQNENSTTDVEVQSTASGEEDKGVRCPCSYDEDDGLMILCAICGYWQHGVCFQVIDEEEAPARHVCHLCASDNDVSTDPSLTNRTEEDVQTVCLWRRALVACLELKQVQPQTFVKRLGVEMVVSQGLYNRLQQEHFVASLNKSKRLGRQVDKDKLNRGLAKYVPRSRAFKSFAEPIDQIVSQTEQMQVDEVAAPEKKVDPRKRKRLMSQSTRELYEFDESLSQEAEESSSKRRRKASVASRSLHVK